MKITLSDQAYALIKRRILDGDLAPGSVISEPHVSSELKLSKAPVRAALLKLQHEGLISSIPRHGYVVSNLSMRDALELLELRSLLEARVAYDATGRTPASFLHGIERAFAQGYDPNDRESVRNYLRVNREFREGIARFAGNSRLWKATVEVNEQLDRYIRLSIMTFDWRAEALARASRLNAAILSDNPELSEQIAREHLYASAATVLYALSLHGAGKVDADHVAERRFGSMLAEGFGALVNIKRWPAPNPAFDDRERRRERVG